MVHELNESRVISKRSWYIYKQGSRKGVQSHKEVHFVNFTSFVSILF